MWAPPHLEPECHTAVRLEGSLKFAWKVRNGLVWFFFSVQVTLFKSEDILILIQSCSVSYLETFRRNNRIYFILRSFTQPPLYYLSLPVNYTGLEHLPLPFFSFWASCFSQPVFKLSIEHHTIRQLERPHQAPLEICCYKMAANWEPFVPFCVYSRKNLLLKGMKIKSNKWLGFPSHLLEKFYLNCILNFECICVF